MDDQPTRTTTDATADMFDLMEADLLRVLRWRARLGELRPPKPGRPRDRRPARQPAARVRDGQLPVHPTVILSTARCRVGFAAGPGG